MRCPYCGRDNTGVITSRPTIQGRIRKRECKSCGREFYTIEQICSDNEGDEMMRDFWRNQYVGKLMMLTRTRHE